MGKDKLSEKSKKYLDTLCLEIPNRRVGSPGNRQAADYFESAVKHFGFETESQLFNCIDTRLGEIKLEAGGELFEAFISPYTIGCDYQGRLAAAENISELELLEAEGKILLLYGEIASEQLMPKNFVFYNPEEHQRIYRLLEEKQPKAVITATSRNPDAVGAIYPFPMIEDGDFDIPAAYMKDEEGQRMLKYSGDTAYLKMDAERISSESRNVISRKGGRSGKKVVLCAHIDAKLGTPGALDNASGVTILMLLAEMLSDYEGLVGVEIAALNGEEYYNAPGQTKYIGSYHGDFSSILFAVNLDDVGYYKDRTAFSLYGMPEEFAMVIHKIYENRPGFIEGPPWYQSDHGIFIANGVPAMAITEENFAELLKEITHSNKDLPDIVDTKKLVDNATALRELITELDDQIIRNPILL